jgi:Tfp pilus assembly protein PilX
MKIQRKNSESGVALLFSILALMLLTAIGATLILMATTETSVNSNYRQEQTAYFGSKAGIEEARARMMATDPGTMNVTGDATHPLLDRTLVGAPTTSNYMIYYLVNEGNVANSVQPWNSANAYADDDLCHEGYGLGLTVVAPEVRCTPTILSATTYAKYTSTLPFAGTSAALPYKWVRISPKLNGSVSYLQGSGSSVSTATYNVNPNPTVPVNIYFAGVPVPTPISINSATLICWDGQEEVPLTKYSNLGSPPVTVSKCSDMTSSAGPFAGAPMTNVYLVTALGVSSSLKNAARKMVQAEVALSPAPPFKYGLYGTSTACPAITFTGNNPTTDSYTTANGGTYATTKTNTGGDIGTNGGVSVGNGNIGGIVGVMQDAPAGAGTCATPVSLGPLGTMVGTVSCPTGGDKLTPPQPCFIPAPYVFPTPPVPSPLPPNAAYNPPACAGKGKVGNCMVPGTYGNITVNGTLNIAPGTYNINSLSMQGNGAINVIPPGAVTFNISGCSNATCSTLLANPLSIAGNGITNDTIPNDFIINYAGTGTISIAGNGNVTAQLDAPNAPITQTGNGAWYGSIVGSTATIGGNAFFHYDTNAALSPNNNGYYTMVSYREVPY